MTDDFVQALWHTAIGENYGADRNYHMPMEQVFKYINIYLLVLSSFVSSKQLPVCHSEITKHDISL